MKKFSFYLLSFLFCFTTLANSTEVDINEITGYGFIRYDDGSKIEGKFILENDFYSKCEECIMTFSDGNMYLSNLKVHNDNYIPTGKVRFVGTIYDYNKKSYKVEIDSTAKILGYGWDYSGKIVITYRNKEYTFYDIGSDDLAEALKSKISSEIPSNDNDNKISNIDLAKNECSELGLETGTEKFADCVLQISK